MAPNNSNKPKIQCISEHYMCDENPSVSTVKTGDIESDFPKTVHNRNNIIDIIMVSKLTPQFVNIHSPVQCSSCSRCNGGGCSRCF